jgi:ketosteroid isomerase-like protein
MDHIALAKRLITAGNAGDWQPLLDHLDEDVVFKFSIPAGTPVVPEIRGKQAVVEHLTRLEDWLGFTQEKEPEFFGSGDRIVLLGQETVEVKKNGVVVPGSEYATVLDFHEGLLTRFTTIQDLTFVVEAYRDQ